jgi:hypothetical protein
MSDSRRAGAAGGEPARTEYEMTLLLERLESLVEEMDEAGATGLDPAKPFSAVREEMEELGITSRADAVARIADLHDQLDAVL